MPRYELCTLLIALINYDAIGGLLLGIVMCSIFLSIGIWFVRTPTERLLEWDRRTGYWLYQRELKQTGDKKVAMKSAGCFYTFFGYTCVVICSFCLLALLTLLVAHLAGFVDIKLIDPHNR